MGDFIVKKNKTEKTSVISVRIDNALLKKFDNLALKANISRNELIIMSMEYSLQNLKFIDDEDKND